MHFSKTLKHKSLIIELDSRWPDLHSDSCADAEFAYDAGTELVHGTDADFKRLASRVRMAPCLAGCPGTSSGPWGATAAPSFQASPNRGFGPASPPANRGGGGAGGGRGQSVLHCSAHHRYSCV